jgi:hypothetical protein
MHRKVIMLATPSPEHSICCACPVVPISFFRRVVLILASIAVCENSSLRKKTVGEKKTINSTMIISFSKSSHLSVLVCYKLVRMSSATAEKPFVLMPPIPLDELYWMKLPNRFNDRGIHLIYRNLTDIEFECLRHEVSVLATIRRDICIHMTEA